MELVTVANWLTSRLNNDAAGVDERVFEDQARDEPYPMIIFQFQGGEDVRGVGTARVMVSGVWLVRAVDELESYNDLGSIADAIDGRLHGAAGNGVIGCVREAPYQRIESEDGVEYRHLGGLYRIYVQ